MNDQPNFTRQIMPPVGRHQHLCLVYDDPATRVCTTVPYLVDGKVSLVSRVIDIRVVVKEAVETIRPAAIGHGLSLEVNELVDPLIVNADADRLRQCILNVLSHAVKYTPRGGAIVVQADRRDTTATIRVSDTGIGIAADRLARIFDRFWRGGNSHGSLRSHRRGRRPATIRGRTCAKWDIAREVTVNQAKEVRLAGTALHRSRHVCAFFNTKDEEYRVLLPFIRDGFAEGDKAFHIVKDEHRPEHRRRLEQAGIAVEAAERAGQLEVRRWEDAYLRDGHFDQQRMLALIEEVLQGGKTQGYPLTRLVANMEWALEDRPGVQDIVEYETRLNYVLPKYDDAVC